MFKIDVDELWQYSLKVYAHKEVKEACLTLQDTMQVNVNLVLSMMYLCRQQLMYEFDDIGKLEQAIASVEQVLIEHRRKRRALKEIDQTRYQQALDKELVLEKEQQKVLVEFANTLEFQHMHSPDYLGDQLGVLCISRVVQNRKERGILVDDSTLSLSVLNACDVIASNI